MVELPEAQTKTACVHQLIIDSYLAAWKEWRRILRKETRFTLPLTPTSRANIIHDHTCQLIEAGIGDIPGVESTDKLDFYALRIEEDILLRFKFLARGVPANVGTKRQRRLARQIYTQDEVLSLVGDGAFVAPTLLTAGYTIDGDEIGRIHIRRDCKPHPPWWFDIYGGDALNHPLVLDGLEDTTKPAIVVSARKKAAESEDVAEA